MPARLGHPQSDLCPDRQPRIRSLPTDQDRTPARRQGINSSDGQSRYSVSKCQMGLWKQTEIHLHARRPCDAQTVIIPPPSFIVPSDIAPSSISLPETRKMTPNIRLRSRHRVKLGKPRYIAKTIPSKLVGRPSRALLSQMGRQIWSGRQRRRLCLPPGRSKNLRLTDSGTYPLQFDGP